MGSQAHYFFAIELPETIKSVLVEWAQDVDKLPFNYKEWVHERDYHLTVKFLGGVTDITIETLCKAIQTRMRDVVSFHLRGNEWGFFGSPRSPRVLWASVQNETGLVNLQKTVEETCEPFGFPKENRPYRPHITIAKKWKDGRFQPSELPALPKVFQESWKVSQLALYQIHPERTPKYDRVASFRFGTDFE